MGRDVIIACDFNSKEEVINFLGKFKEEKPFVKIGMELFYARSPVPLHKTAPCRFLQKVFPL